MGRAHLYANFLQASQGVSGPLTLGQGRTGYVYERGTTRPIGQTMYASESGVSVLTQPLVMDGSGTFEAWVQYAQPIDLLVSGVPAPYQLDFEGNANSIGVRYGGTIKADGQSVLTATVNAGQPFVFVPIGGAFGGFTQADVGKRIAVVLVQRQADGTYNETNIANGVIVSCGGPTQVTMSVNASQTVTYTPPTGPNPYPDVARVLWASDDTAAVQALIETMQPSASSPAGTEIRLPPGIIGLTDAVVYDNRHGARLIGASASSAGEDIWHGTTLVGFGSGQSILKINGEHLQVDGIALEGAGKNAAVGLDQTDDALHYTTFRHVMVNACGTGILSKHEQYSNDFYNVLAWHCGDGLAFIKTGVPAIQKVNFYDCSFEHNQGTGILLSGTELVSFFGGTSQLNQRGTQIVAQASQTHFYGMHHEGNRVAAVDIRKDSPTSPNYASVVASWSGCRFYGGGTGFTGKAVISNGSLSASFNHCYFDQFPSASVSVLDFANGGSGGGIALNFGNVVSADCRFQDNGAPVFGTRNGVDYGYALSATVTQSGAQTIASDLAGHVISINLPVYDPNYMIAVGGGSIQVPYDGTYVVTGAIRLAAAAGGTTRQGAILKNGAAVAVMERPPSASNPTDFVLSVVVQCVAGDSFTLWALQDSGGALSVVQNAAYPRLSVARLP